MWDWLADKVASIDWKSVAKTVAVVVVSTVAFVAVTALTGGLGAPALLALGAGGFASGAAGYATSELLEGRRPKLKAAIKAGVDGAVVTVLTAGAGRVLQGAVQKVAPSLASKAPVVVRTASGGALGGGAKMAENVYEGRPLLEGVAQQVAIGSANGLVLEPLEARIGKPSARAGRSIRERLTGQKGGEAPGQIAPPSRGAGGPPETPVVADPAPEAPAQAAAHGPPSPARAPPAPRDGLAQAIDPTIPRGEAAGAGAETSTPSEPASAPATARSTEPAPAPRAQLPELGEEEPAPASRTPEQIVLGETGWDTPLGTSSRVGDFRGLAGKTVPEVLSRIPASAEVRVLRPVEGGASAGREYKWNDGSSTYRVRIHDADPSAPAGSNAHDGWIVRVHRQGPGKFYLDDQGNPHHQNSHNEASPHYDPSSAQATHIPLAGNPHAPEASAP